MKKPRRGRLQTITKQTLDHVKYSAVVHCERCTGKARNGSTRGKPEESSGRGSSASGFQASRMTVSTYALTQARDSRGSRVHTATTERHAEVNSYDR